MSLRDLTSGSCSGGASNGASSSAAGGPLSALANSVVGGPGSTLPAPTDAAANAASDLNALVQGSLNTEPLLEEGALPAAMPPIPGELSEFANLGPQFWPAQAPPPPPPSHLPQFFPPDFLRPFTAVPEPDPHAATAEFEAAFHSAQNGPGPMRPLGPLGFHDPLAYSQRERTRQLFPAADNAFVESQVTQFMSELSLHGRPPVGPFQMKHPGPMPFHAPPPHLPFANMHPQAFHPGVALGQQFAAPPAAGSTTVDAAVPAEVAANGDSANPGLRESIFQEFMHLLQGENSPAAAAAQIGNPLEEQGDLTAEKTELDVFESRALNALSGANQSWGDEFTSLDSFNASPTLAARAFEETWAPTNEFEHAFDDTYASDLTSYLGGDPATTAYAFEQENEFSGKSAAEALAEGERLRAVGELGRALDAFEEAVNRPAEDPHPPLEGTERARAWFLLGTTHAECDDDVRAIQALSRVGVVEPSADSSEGHARTCAAALLALAVSYTNELDAARAIVHIRRWLEAQGALWEDGLGGIEGSLADAAEEGYVEGEVTGQLVWQLRRAAEMHPDDAEVHIAQGIVHSLNRDYALASAAFRVAVSMRKDDARMWNKLGATLANGGESDDALRAYRRAVDICPAYTRAWVNVGTAYGNRGEHAKAIRYYLRALAATGKAEEGGRGKGKRCMEDMGHVWGYMRSALISLGMAELVPDAEQRNLDAFRPHFAF